jgi:1-acyl-sn-glycerol-3-phosphate acyltransferase
MPEINPVQWPGERMQARRRLKPAPFQRAGHLKTMAGALAATGTLLGPAYAHKLLSRQSAGGIPMLWHRVMTRSLGVHSRVAGEPVSGSVLYVSNHLSWLDIPVLGSRLRASFVAKAEVGSMGFVGLLADIQGTIYVERERRHRSAEQAGEIEERLQAGDNIILFPEGTSNDGVRVLPFKSSLFAVVEGKAAEKVRIQPITLAYTHLNGLPLTRHRMMDIAWIGDMELGSHAIDFMKLGRVEARILCHPPVRRADFADRKALARHCHDVISNGYHKLMRGQI